MGGENQQHYLALLDRPGDLARKRFSRPDIPRRHPAQDSLLLHRPANCLRHFLILGRVGNENVARHTNRVGFTCPQGNTQRNPRITSGVGGAACARKIDPGKCAGLLPATRSLNTQFKGFPCLSKVCRYHPGLQVPPTSSTSIPPPMIEQVPTRSAARSDFSTRATLVARLHFSIGFRVAIFALVTFLVASAFAQALGPGKNAATPDGFKARGAEHTARTQGSTAKPAADLAYPQGW